MSEPRGSWEGTILNFVVILSVLMGVAYVLAINFRLPIPWLAIVALAALAAGGVRFARRRRGLK